jgi:hypothetical protein
MRRKKSGNRSRLDPVTWQDVTAVLARHILHLSRITSRRRRPRVSEMRRWAHELHLFGKPSMKSADLQEVSHDR